MLIEQAIFTSARTAKVQGYHLVSRSPGIDEENARVLTKWSPSHGALVGPEPDAESLNYHAAARGHLALSRSFYGGPEYSARRGLQIVTRILLLKPEQFKGYDDNPLRFARLALALGHLRFENRLPPELQGVEMPRRCTGDSHPTAAHPSWCGLLGDLVRTISAGGQVCVVGVQQPTQLLSVLFSRIPPRRRLELSFATALAPSMHRPFHLHFLPALNSGQQRQLESKGIHVLRSSSRSVATSAARR